MRPAPGPIPNKMPPLEKAVQDIVFLLDMPRMALMDYSLSELINTYSDGSPKWLTGSTVWLPAVFGEIDKYTDLDIVFQNKEGLDRFVDGTLDTLLRRRSGYIKVTNGNNGQRIIDPDARNIIDAWHLEDDESIHELLMTFPQNYQRCAYFVTWSGSSPGYLTRNVKERIRFRTERATGGYGR